MQWPWTYSIAVPGKRQRRGGMSISLLPDRLNTKKLPSMKVHVDEQGCTALIDSGCSQTLASKAVCRFWKQKSARVLTADGRTLNCQGYGRIKVEVGQVPAVDIEALNSCWVLTYCWGLMWSRNSVMSIWWNQAKHVLEAWTDELDFSVTYDRSNKEWTASWKWVNSHSPSELSNSVQEYAVPCHARDTYENLQILQWQWNGWLLPYQEELGTPKGLIPLIAVMQEQKPKVHLVFDYRELNGFVNAFTANAEVCA